MARLELSVMVNASPEAVFGYVDAHENYHWMFRTPRLTWTTPRHQIGSRLKMELKLASVPVLVDFETTMVNPNAKIAGVYRSGLKGSWEWRFEPAGAATNLTFITDYRLPLGILGQIADRALVERGVHTELEWTLAHIKESVEARMQAA